MHDPANFIEPSLEHVTPIFKLDRSTIQLGLVT